MKQGEGFVMKIYKKLKKKNSDKLKNQKNNPLPFFTVIRVRPITNRQESREQKRPGCQTYKLHYFQNQ